MNQNTAVGPHGGLVETPPALVGAAAAPLPPPLAAGHALFLDFDGTLVDIAPTPDGVALSPAVVPVLAVLHRQLGGALGIITGRPPDQIEALLSPLQLAVAGEHGASIRWPDGRSESAPVPDLLDVIRELDAFVQAHDGLLLERKSHGVALHYRAAPALADACVALAQRLSAAQPGMVMLHGKAVVELKSASVDKGRALRALMQAAPFAGRVPVFIGDDTTDEAGIVAAQALGGIGVKVAEGASAARHRLAGPVQVLDYLARAADGLAAPGTAPA